MLFIDGKMESLWKDKQFDVQYVEIIDEMWRILSFFFFFFFLGGGGVTLLCHTVSSFMYQTNCINIGFQLILIMLIYVALSSGRYTNYHS